MYTDIFKKSNIRYVWIAVILILVYWVCSRFLAGPLKTQVETFDGYISDDLVYSEIPLDIYQTWKTKDLPPKMRECVENLKKKNPEFRHHLYDDEDCYKFIQKNFEPEVAAAYDSLIPGAYKADLWRYCILYKHGGIYLDIKYCNVGDFKLIELTDQEYFVYDSTCYLKTNDTRSKVDGIYNALMVCSAGNPKLLNCINKIVENVKNNYYGELELSPTGPLLIVKEFTDYELTKLKKRLVFSNKTNRIDYKGKPIFSMYNEYYTMDYKQPYYKTLWEQRKIYK